MKLKIYYQDKKKLKTKIIDQTYTSNLPNNIIKIKQLKTFKEYMTMSYFSSNEIVDLFKELSIILNTNLSFDQSIDILLQGNNSKKINEILTTIKTAITNAQPIHKALKVHQKYIGNLPILFFQLSYTNGNIKDSIKALSIVLIENQRAKKQFVSALTYPAILLLTLFISIALIFNFILPKFDHIFIQFGDNLPLATKILLDIKYLFDNYYIAIFTLIIACIISFQYFYKKYTILYDKFIAIDIPLISKMYRLFIFYRLFLSLNMLVNSKYTFQTALKNTKHIVNNKFILFKIEQIINDIQNGATISTAFKNSKLINNLILRLLNTGQETNTLPDILINITNIYKEKLDDSIKYFTLALSPFFVAIIASVVLWLVLAIMLPIWNLNSVLN